MILAALVVAQRLGALELDLVAAVHDAVEDGVGQGRIVEVGVPGQIGRASCRERVCLAV